MRRCRQFALVGVALGIVGITAGCGTTAPPKSNLTNNSSAPATVQNANFPSNSASSYLTYMDMIDSQTGYVAGYSEGQFAIWRTTDGGARWTHILVPDVPMLTTGVYPPVAEFRSINKGWIVWIATHKQGHVLHVLNTTDGGRTWTVHTKNVISVAGYVRQIDFSSAKDGWIQTFSGGVMNQGDTTIYHTDDGGKIWTMVSSAKGYVPNRNATSHALPELDVPMPMTFTNAQDGWVAVGNVVVTKTMASLYYTRTAGTVWKAIPLPIPKEDQNGFMTTEYEPVFTGRVGTELIEISQGGINRVVSYVTSNTGKSWTVGSSVSLSQNEDWVRQSFLNAQNGWIIGNTGATFERTTNAGRSWSTLQVNGSLKTMLHNGFTVKQLGMVTEKTGWILLEFVNSQNGQIRTKVLKTTDGGYHWVVQNNIH